MFQSSFSTAQKRLRELALPQTLTIHETLPQLLKAAVDFYLHHTHSNGSSNKVSHGCAFPSQPQKMGKIHGNMQNEFWTKSGSVFKI